MSATLRYKITKIDATEGTYGVSYWIEENPSVVMRYTYLMPTNDDGSVVSKQLFLDYITARAPLADLVAKASSIVLDTSHLDDLVEKDEDEVVVSDPYEGLTFGEIQSKLIEEVDTIARNVRNTLMLNYSPFEAAAWPIKLAQAKLYKESGLETDAPDLLSEATSRGITLAALVEKVLSKAELFIQLENMISGYAGKLIDQLRAVADGDIAALLAIDIESEWPIS